MANFMKVEYLNAGDFLTTDGVDGIHFTPENNATLGKALAVKVEEILQ